LRQQETDPIDLSGLIEEGMWTLFVTVRMKVLHSDQVGKQSNDEMFVDLSFE